MQKNKDKNNKIKNKEMLVQQFIFCDRTHIEKNGVMIEEEHERAAANIIYKPAQQSNRVHIV